MIDPDAKPPSRPWQVVGVDKLPDDDRYVEMTVSLGGEKRKTVVGYYSSREKTWCGSGFTVLAWCELREPWQGEAPK